ncbi:kinase [Bacillus sp. SJS]|uniref:kinase n=1 Tax=Bacillus sp. SJS TaxID=1423321 RepID=UPI00068A8F8F|nr:kinase [Bacillus sp. SJS]KZZ83969.1 uridine kinase [Bacillus sp. SJS]
MIDDRLTVVLTRIPHPLQSERFILGIDGLSRSGKTTLVKKLKTVLEQQTAVQVFHIDDYIEKRNKRYNTGEEEWFEYYGLQWDVKGLQESFFSQLRCGTEITLPFYESETDTITNQMVNLSEACVIIIEGVFLQRSEWREYFDLMVYLDCPRDKRFMRESVHTQTLWEKFQNRYWPAEDYYVKTEKPEKNADLVLIDK